MTERQRIWGQLPTASLQQAVLTLYYSPPIQTSTFSGVKWPHQTWLLSMVSPTWRCHDCIFLRSFQLTASRCTVSLPLSTSFPSPPSRHGVKETLCYSDLNAVTLHFRKTQTRELIEIQSKPPLIALIPSNPCPLRLKKTAFSLFFSLASLCSTVLFIPIA